MDIAAEYDLVALWIMGTYLKSLALWSQILTGKPDLLEVWDPGGATNQIQGELRQTGIFLKEDGSAGTVQQIDLVV